LVKKEPGFLPSLEMYSEMTAVFFDSHKRWRLLSPKHSGRVWEPFFFPHGPLTFLVYPTWGEKRGELIDDQRLEGLSAGSEKLANDEVAVYVDDYTRKKVAFPIYQAISRSLRRQDGLS
jgi:hypothetical protein